MSRQTNNTPQPSRFSSDAYAWYVDGDRVHMDLVSPRSRFFHHARIERGGVDPWWWSLQDRILTLPSSMMSFPRPRMHLVMLHNNLANNANLRPRATVQSQELSPEEQKKAIAKFKREIYNPIPKKIIQRLGRFYRQNGAHKTEKEADEEEDDDDKRCVVCLEDFEPKEVVMVTPCNHMFHEDCILPWVNSHRRCPICRFLFYERSGEGERSSTNNDNPVNDQVTNELISFVTAPGGSTSTTEPFWF